MKTIKRILAIFTLTVVLVSCSNDDNPPAETGYQEQNPLAGFLAASGFNQSISEVGNGLDYEYGIAFKPTVKGKITAIVAKLPDDVMVGVTIWDKAAGTVYRDGILNVTQSGVEFTQPVDIELEKNKEYMITINSNDWYRHAKSDNSNVAYPFALGDISITGYGYKSGTAQVMPDTFPLNFYSGDLSFKFQQTE